MKKLIKTDFTRMNLPKQNIGGSVTKAVQKQTESFNGPAITVDKVLEAGGAITNGANSVPKVDVTSPVSVNGKSASNEIKMENVIAGILVVGVIVATVVIVIKIKNSRKKNKPPKTK